tara:strand:- start:233 stop:688 length:456 start_codon:yes stop_codon:yes gene_type:complete
MKKHLLFKINHLNNKMTSLDEITLSEPLSTLLYQRALMLIPEDPLDQKNIVQLTLRMMQIVQEIANDKPGVFRKRMLLLVLKKIVDNNTILSVDDKSNLITLIDTTITCMIDEVIKVWNRQTTFYPRSRCNCLRNVFRKCTSGWAFSFDRL